MSPHELHLASVAITAAQSFAHQAHDSSQQKRKYSDEPYWVHTDAVAELVSQTPHVTTEQIIAAHLHDVLEDVAPVNDAFSYGRLLEQFGPVVAQHVLDLTDLYTKEAYPTWNRAKRKAKEAERLALISPGSKTIKLADIVHNGQSITAHDPKFAKVFLREKALLLPSLQDGDPELFHQASML